MADLLLMMAHSQVNLPLIFSIDVSENPYRKSIKPQSKPTSDEMNRDHKTVDTKQKNWKMEENATVQDCVHSYFG